MQVRALLKQTGTNDAARIALTDVLENQALRPTSHGDHIAPYSAVVAQLDPPIGAVLRPFDRMRRTRNRAEYPSFTTPDVTADSVNTDFADGNRYRRNL